MVSDLRAVSGSDHQNCIVFTLPESSCTSSKTHNDFAVFKRDILCSDH